MNMSLSTTTRDSLRSLAISDNGFVFDPKTGNAYTLNQTGIIVLRRLKEGREVHEIALELEREFPDVSSVQDDVRDFLRLLREVGLMDEARKEAT
jgi:hypothetical protein